MNEKLEAGQASFDQRQVDKSNVPLRPAVYVRLGHEQYLKIHQDSEDSGESMPDLMKRSYFSRCQVNVLLPKTELRPLIGQLGRIGNNLNQISKVLNKGFRSGFTDDLATVQRDLTALMAFLTGKLKRNSVRA